MRFEKVDIGPATLYRGDCFDLMRSGFLEEFDAVITDPPYASGGMYRGDRCNNPSKKYEGTLVQVKKPSFAHDAKDQRAFMSWCQEWFSLLPVKTGGYVLSFIDWRQLPAITDAMQWSGLMWRGVCVWDKEIRSRATHRGYARHQAEFIVWGTKGPCPIATHGGPWPGVYRYPVLQADKFHMVGKPTPLMEDLVQWVPPGGSVFDPFMGSATTAAACLRTGRKFVGVEIVGEYFEIAKGRIKREWDRISGDIPDQGAASKEAA